MGNDIVLLSAWGRAPDRVVQGGDEIVLLERLFQHRERQAVHDGGLRTEQVPPEPETFEDRAERREGSV
jgi:hypothetical protein